MVTVQPPAPATLRMERTPYSAPLPFKSDASARGDEAPLVLSLGFAALFAIGALVVHRPAAFAVAGVFAVVTLLMLFLKRAPAPSRRRRTP